jgi:type IV pilus assembly protein PilC
VSLLDVAHFAAEFQTMYAAGMGIPRTLGLLADGHRKRKRALAEALDDIRDAVEQGARLGDACRRHRALLGDLCVELIAAGEQTGSLEAALESVSKDYEYRHRTRSVAVSALVEPAIIVAVGLAVAYLILTVTVPRFRELYAALAPDAGLPLATRGLVSVADALVSAPGLLLTFTLALAAAGAAVSVRRSERVRYGLHRAWVRWPLVGEMLLWESVGRGCRTLGLTVRSVGDVPAGLRLAGKTCGNLYVRDAFVSAAESVQDGRLICDSLRETGVFPDACVSMVETGETTGRLDAMLLRLADAFEAKVRSRRERLLMLARPALVVVMGALVLGIMLAMYLPVFTLIQELQRH